LELSLAWESRERKTFSSWQFAIIRSAMKVDERCWVMKDDYIPDECLESRFFFLWLTIPIGK
jgi:hypothetical protein